MLLTFVIGICTFGTVNSDHDYLTGLSQLAFGGAGEKTCDSNGNCAAKFSSGFRSDICSLEDYKASYDILDPFVYEKADDCWGICSFCINYAINFVSDRNPRYQ